MLVKIFKVCWHCHESKKKFLEQSMDYYLNVSVPSPFDLTRAIDRSRRSLAEKGSGASVSSLAQLFQCIPTFNFMYFHVSTSFINFYRAACNADAV